MTTSREAAYRAADEDLARVGETTEDIPAITAELEQRLNGMAASYAPASADELRPGAPADGDPHFMYAFGRRVPVDLKLAESGYDCDRSSHIAGPLTEPQAGKEYRVQYRRIHHNRREFVMTRLIAVVLLALDARFMWWLVEPSHWPDLAFTVPHAMTGDTAAKVIAELVGMWLLRFSMVLGSILMQAFLMGNVLSIARASVAARYPIPVTPPLGLRIILATTMVPGKEPWEMVKRTLEAALRVPYNGGPGSYVHVWLLDEGADKKVQAACAVMGVHYFTRKNQGYLEQETGWDAQRTKHGNYNSFIRKHGEDYDILIMFDTDNVPLPPLVERMAGYFRDPNVAYVVGPQDYENQGTHVSRWATSAQYPFHSLLQPAGNRYRCAMLVGTCAAIRLTALRQSRGWKASITEDMATALKILALINPLTGKRWEAVYIPDLLCVGEGPSSWGDFFGQKSRWSAGTFMALRSQFLGLPFKVRPGVFFHYALMLTYYPSVALGCLVGMLVSVLYLTLGLTGLHTDQSWWLNYYVDLAAVQFGLFWYMRRYNVSPHEPVGSTGFAGMAISALTAPIYTLSFIQVMFLRHKSSFKVTAKGGAASTDSLWTFRLHLAMAAIVGAILGAALWMHRTYPLMLGWAVALMTICLAPVAIWQIDCLVDRFRRPQVPVNRTTKTTTTTNNSLSEEGTKE